MKNSLLMGVLLGAIVPILAFVLTRYTGLQSSFFSDKPIAIYVIAAVINLMLFRFSYRAGKDVFARGVLLITFVAMIVLIFGTKLTV